MRLSLSSAAFVAIVAVSCAHDGSVDTIGSKRQRTTAVADELAKQSEPMQISDCPEGVELPTENATTKLDSVDISHSTSHQCTGTETLDDKSRCSTDCYFARYMGKQLASEDVNEQRRKIERVIEEHADEVQHCYEQQLTKRPVLNGRIDIQCAINGIRKATDLTVKFDSVGDPQLLACILVAIESWTFDISTIGTHVATHGVSRWRVSRSLGGIALSFLTRDLSANMRNRDRCCHNVATTNERNAMSTHVSSCLEFCRIVL